MARENKVEKLKPIQYKILQEIYKACEALDADPDLLALINSWGDTLPEDHILDMLEDYNTTGKCIHEIH